MSVESATLLENIASTDIVQSVFLYPFPHFYSLFSLRSDWDNLRDVIKASIQKVS